jgi:hypothetical protein
MRSSSGGEIGQSVRVVAVTVSDVLDELLVVVPEFGPTFDAHVADYGILPHVLFGDFARFVLAAHERRDTDVEHRSLAFLDWALREGDDDVENLVAVSSSRTSTSRNTADSSQCGLMPCERRRSDNETGFAGRRTADRALARRCRIGQAVAGSEREIMSDDPRTELIHVPDIIMMRLSRAVRLLEVLDFAWEVERADGKVGPVSGGSVVVSQEPAAPRQVPLGTAVRIRARVVDSDT